MKANTTILLAAALAACGGKSETSTTPRPAPETAAAPQAGLKIKLTTLYVDDQDKALQFYTDVLGFEEKADISNEGYRWLTVTAPGDADGPELQLALDAAPAANAYQEAMFAQSHPAAMFFTGDIRADYERIKARGAAFTMAPTEVTAGSVIATLDDGCGNLIQITQLAR
jgi:predicted enzyme related to lactoylglutathione lyase